MTTEPSDLSAAKAWSVEKIWLTPERSWLATEKLLPPELKLPQVTTEPSLFRAAKARPVEKIWVTPPSPPRAGGVVLTMSKIPQVTTEPSAFSAAKAYQLRHSRLVRPGDAGRIGVVTVT